MNITEWRAAFDQIYSGYINSKLLEQYKDMSKAEFVAMVTIMKNKFLLEKCAELGRINEQLRNEVNDLEKDYKRLSEGENED